MGTPACDFSAALTGKTLVVFAHGNGRPITADTVQMPQGFSLWTFNKSKDAMWSTEIKEVGDQMNLSGIIPEEIHGYKSRPSLDLYPNYPVNFNDSNGLEGVIPPWKLGLYAANPCGSAGHKLKRINAPQYEATRTDVSDLVAFASVNGFGQLLLLTCRTGPTVRVEGVHVPEGVCTTPHAELMVGKEYEDVCLETLPCLNCMADVSATRICFARCQFQMLAQARPHANRVVALPLSAAPGVWQVAGDEETVVDLLPATVRLRLTTKARLTEM